jgi:hypothetical protein
MSKGFLRSLLRRLLPKKDKSDAAQQLYFSHRRDDDQYQFEFLKVLLFREGDHWIAQGLDIDYSAAGDSIADVKRRFAYGLCLTIEQNLARTGSLDGLVRPAPPHIWQMYYRMERSLHGSVQDLSEQCRVEVSPSFSRLRFMEPVPAPASASPALS